MSYVNDVDFLQRARARLGSLTFGPDWTVASGGSDFDLNPEFRPLDPPTPRPAAVLAPVVLRPNGATLLLTQRTDAMPTHAGQIAFPGGRIQPEDDGPVAAAVRECSEETGIAARHVTPIGALAPYRTVTNFVVAPIVATLDPGFSLDPDPREVADVFEAPLAFLMDPANHERHERDWQGGRRAYYVMPWEGRFIWGATAAMIKMLYDRLYGDP